MKRCPKCDKQKDELEFHNNRCHDDGKETYCKPCKKEQVTAYFKTDKGKATAAKAQRKYINTAQGRTKKRELDRKWYGTEVGKQYASEKFRKRYHSDPEHYRLKAIAQRNGCLIGVLKQVQDRDKVCQLCGSDKEPQFDHIHPVSYGGIGSLENLQILCKPCNNFKSNNLFLPGGGMLVTQACKFSTKQM